MPKVGLASSDKQPKDAPKNDLPKISGKDSKNPSQASVPKKPTNLDDFDDFNLDQPKSSNSCLLAKKDPVPAKPEPAKPDPKADKKPAQPTEVKKPAKADDFGDFDDFDKPKERSEV